MVFFTILDRIGDVAHLQKKVQGRKRRRRLSYNSKTLLALLLFFPLGLTRMWRRRCSWKPAVKCAISALLAAAFALVILAPSPSVGSNGGIQLYGDKPAVAVYGPKLPENYVLANVPVVAGDSVVYAQDALVDDRYYVYANETCYHLESCDFFSDNSKKLTLYEAHFSGYAPCGTCNPPLYGSMQ